LAIRISAPETLRSVSVGKVLGWYGGRLTLRTGQQSARLFQPDNLGVDFCNQGVDADRGYSPVPTIAPGSFLA